MGLLKFFSSKRSSEKSANNIKAQAYDATTASLPPLLGTYPVAGNGPTNVFEDLQRSHHKMSETNLSLVAGSEASAPAPPVPRFRDASVERPSSAPNGAGPSSSSPSSRRGRDSSKGPPLSFRKPRLGSVTSTGSPAPRRGSQSPAIPFEGEPFRPPTAPFAHNRHFSIQSNSSMARGFIDILDAQSEIKPSGFQNRVKAAGVRDYGEDVADRNIGENGVDLASAKVQAFYATNGGSPHDRQDGAPAPSVSMAQFGDKDQPFKPPRRHDSLDMGGRTKSLTSASVGQIPFRTTIFNPDRSQRHETIMEDVPESARSRRRQSLGSYSLGSFIPTTPSNGPLDVHKIADSSVSPSTRRQKRRSTTGGEAPLNELGIFSTRPTESPSSPKTSQKPVYVVKHNYSLPVQQRPKTSGHAQPETYQAVRPPSRGGSVANSTFSSPTQKTPSKRHTLSLSATGVPSFRNGELSSRNVIPDDDNDARGRVGRVEVESFVDSGDGSSPAPSPHVMRNGPSWRESQDERLKGNGSPRKNNKLDEICEHVPIRTSSLRHWSISSATPTMSSTSSFPRPQSRHTATTSVDLATMSSFMNDSCSSLHSGTADHTSFCTALESALPSPVDAATPGAGFNIDDYLSSDDDVDADSFITTRHRDSGLGATQEEELLFSDSGYGEAGLQLPGLFDSLSAVPEPSYVSPSRPSMRQSHSFGSPVRFQRRFSLDPRVEAPIFSLDEEDDGPGDYDILPARADLALGRRGTRRISAIGTVYQSIEEEREEKVDVRTAIRLRKEAKAKQRAMARLSRVQRRKAVDDDADHADVE
ncbi:hypothetical protein CGCF415_v009757 [Colletotrichum fructicola]|uniref:Uncharacterized protein n=1 Tax=Colletotrichum fructicola (strain Nara gc5) TaxID=1213859 RepID=A0A7J6JE55_COLFN|nr:uncharacterized protein CGMCC3_g14845 [Colletotrichum fructicola]KAF4488586.1 hypothetical protein CGGC5_v004255 [Colletotrichum fructicola Nara gc5]KAE9569092.1 hypothetical protein CGMCC3_g14845 [Colletotrichum fructicola]KAF4425505.1 hypothetical protein CFRS1_v000239 [Colletotrichum fructicola]KAF4892746.1 hypothetical protein CGCFRS4_v007428 [Colletotrichum fructicola]KAF4901550.1 hypothetical protein CGCF415_v009757 [Colletotrichum fructicola]